mmetsp:Transcript_21128/g.56054  ORF Transcript_21128/g.56054 Transcript_21128/m.56054 type:complete len:118 (-) Transcript_21128:9-362(-)
MWNTTMNVNIKPNRKCRSSANLTSCTLTTFGVGNMKTSLLRQSMAKPMWRRRDTQKARTAAADQRPRPADGQVDEAAAAPPGARRSRTEELAEGIIGQAAKRGAEHRRPAAARAQGP